MRSSLVLSSLVLVAFLSGFATRNPVIGSEAGMTSGTPVLTAAELKALAPDPMPVVDDPATEVPVTLKGVNEAERSIEAAAEARKVAAAKKAAAKKAAEKKAADKKKSDAKAKTDKTAKKSDSKKDEKAAKKTDSAKKTDDKVSKKTDSKKKDDSAKKSEKKSDTKVAKKPETKKTTPKAEKKSASVVLAMKDAEVDEAVDADSEEADVEEPLAPKVAKKTEKKTEKPATQKSPAKADVKLASAKKSPQGAAKMGRARILPEDLPATTEDAEEGDEADEAEEAPVAPKPSKKSTTKKVAPATEPVDPNHIAAADVERYRAALTPFLSKIATPEAGGSVQVEVRGMKRGTVAGKPAVQVEGVRIVATNSRFQASFMKKAVMELRDLALDEQQLKAGTCALVGTPTLVPDITLEHAKVLEKLGRSNVKNPTINYENNQMVFAGNVKVMFFSIGFKMRGRWERNANNVSFRIAELELRGSKAGADRLATAQAKMENIIKLEEALSPIGAPGAPVRGGKLSIEEGTAVVYSTPLDPTVLAE